MKPPIRRGLGFFTRLLDDAAPAERYRLATEQIVTAERLGFDTAWVAQHHFSESEGGLPSPFVFLAQVAARTSTIRLGTGIVTLPLDNPVRVAEDAAVLDQLAAGRLEVGVGPGGTASSFAAFGQDSARRGEIMADHLAKLLDAWRGRPIAGEVNRLYPPAPGLPARVWQATFNVEGGARAGAAGDGLMLSRTQPRSREAPSATLADIQNPIIDAYLDALPPGCVPRIMASRSVFVADDRAEARRLAEAGMRRFLARLATLGRTPGWSSVDDMVKANNSHLGTPEQVIASLQADATLERATDIAFQVHPMDPPHPYILRSLELVADEVAPALDCGRRSSPATRLLDLVAS